MDGHETWEETLNGTFGVPEMVFAPEVGRFAMSRIVSSTGDLMLGSMIPDGATQEMRVYQTESGDLLLKVPTTPVTRFAENFDLSDDGMVAAVVNAGAVLVFKLPPPSAQDVKDLELARSFSPPASEAQVRLARMEESQEGGDGAPPPSDVASAAPAPASAGSASAAAASAPAAAAAAEAKKEDVSLTAGGAGNSGGKAADADEAASSITDDEARAAMRKDVAGSNAEAAGGTAGAAADPDPGSGDAVRRKPPTLLEPGETVEKVKSPTQQSSSR
jgi:hypothetical protein